MYSRRRSFRSKRKTSGFKSRVRHQKRKSKKYGTFRISRGGIRL